MTLVLYLMFCSIKILNKAKVVLSIYMSSLYLSIFLSCMDFIPGLPGWNFYYFNNTFSTENFNLNPQIKNIVQKYF